MAAIFRIHGLMKAIKKGNFITHHSKYRFNIVTRRSSSSYFSYYPSNSSCECVTYDIDKILEDRRNARVLGCLYKQGRVPPDVSICNIFLDWFIGVDKTHEAENLFKKMLIFNNNESESADELLVLCEPDIVSYNTMFKGLCKVGNNFTAIALLRLMDGRGCKPDIVSYNTLIDGLCSDPGVVNTIDDALKLLNEMVFIKGIRPDSDTYKSLIFAFSKLGRWDEVCKMLKRMEVDENVELDLKILNIIVDALCKQNKLKDARGVFIYMRENGYHPNIATFNSFIQMFCSRGQMSAASETLDLLQTTGIEPDRVTYNMLIDGYLNTLIDGYLKDKKEDLVIKMFSEMRTKDKVTHFLVSGLLIPRTNHHHYQSKLEYRDGVMSSYLYHLYMHGDSFDEALDLFDFMDERYEELNSNIEVYNVLIFGANNCGRFDVARKLFHELTVKGLLPDQVTYTLIIRSFWEQGLYNDARRMFLEMKQGLFLPDGVVKMSELPLCYLEQPYFYCSACVSCDMSGIQYGCCTNIPLVANLLTLNLPQQFLESPALLMARVNQSC